MVAEIHEELQHLGVQVIAVSPDAPDVAMNMVKERGIPFRVVSDSDLKLAMAFGLAYKVDSETVEMYKKYNIDLAASSGRDHHSLPVPAVFAISRSGTVTFVEWDADYRNRVSRKTLLSEANALVRH